MKCSDGVINPEPRRERTPSSPSNTAHLDGVLASLNDSKGGSWTSGQAD